MLSRATFYPTLLYNVVMEKVSSRRWYDRIDDTVLLGALPFRGMTQQLVSEENVKGVVTLNEDFETAYFVNNKEEWEASGVEQLRLNTIDLVEAPTQDKLVLGVNFIMRHQNAGSTVYVHCKAGRTRSTTVVGCYLMKRHSMTPETAIDMIRAKRSHIILRSAQWQALHTYYNQNVKS